MLANISHKNTSYPLSVDQPKQQKFILSVYMLIASYTLLIYGLVHIYNQNRQLGIIETVLSATTIITLVGLRSSLKYWTAVFCFMLTLVAILFVLLIGGGIENTGIFWFFLYPVVAFFLTGQRYGLGWMAGLGVMIGITYLLADNSVISLPYSAIDIRQAFVVLAVITIGMYVYERTREVAYRKEREVEKTKVEFISTASHQLRTPVSAIAWCSEMLLNGEIGKLTDKQIENIQSIHESNQRMVTIIDDMLVLSSLSVDGETIDLKPSDITTISQEVVKEIESTILKNRALSIREKYQPKLPKIQLDKKYTKIILHQLLSNAVKYTPDDGTVSVEIKTSSTIKKSTHQLNTLHITVSDTGYGIPKDEQSKIFTKFFRASNVKIKDTDGTGLGLFVVKDILDHTGGKIKFSSSNQGSKFEVILPMSGMKDTKKEGKNEN